MTKSSIMIDLDDPRTIKVAEVLSNKTSKKIANLLAEKEMSESEIAKELKLPANTINYNIKKLIDAGLIEKSSGFLWSEKGKRIYKYKVSNRKIIISPISSKIKGIIPTAIISALLAVGVKIFIGSNDVVQKTVDGGEVARIGVVSEYAADTAIASQGTVMEGISHIYSPWAWFLLGAWFALFVFVVWSIARRDD